MRNNFNLRHILYFVQLEITILQLFNLCNIVIKILSNISTKYVKQNYNFYSDEI